MAPTFSTGRCEFRVRHPGRWTFSSALAAVRLSGTLTDRRSQPVPVTQVVLIPDRSRDRTELYRTANTDENGRFNFIGITPGDYKVFSWDGLEPYGWFDPDVMAQSETKGVSVRVTDSSSEMIDVKLIPREVAQ